MIAACAWSPSAVLLLLRRDFPWLLYAGVWAVRIGFGLCTVR